MAPEFSTIQQAVDAIARGEVVIVVDAEDRENEGDYICAAEKATPETMNLVLSGRGDFCLSVLPETADRLEIVPLVDSNNSKLGTAFMTPLDHVDCRTGVTADERCLTVKTIADPHSRPEDFVRPGHVHLLVAKQGAFYDELDILKPVWISYEWQVYSRLACYAKFWMKPGIVLLGNISWNLLNNRICKSSRSSN